MEHGIWIEAEGSQFFNDLAQLPGVIEGLAEKGITDIYLQLHRSGKCWFKSDHGDPSPYLNLVNSHGLDPLRLVLDKCMKLGINLHAWLNVFNLGREHSPSVVSVLGVDELLHDCQGVRIDSYDQNGAPPDDRNRFFAVDTPGLWIDPASDAYYKEFLSLTAGLLKTYPELCGVHLDFFRYPYFLPLKPSSRISCGYDFGYGEKSLEKFADTEGLKKIFKKDNRGILVPLDDGVSLRWDRWRRNNVDRYLLGLRGVIGPKKILSVAALAWPERAYFTAFQNWRRWMLNDLVDKICLMSYTADTEHFSYLVRQACSFRSKKSKLVAGVGTYLFAADDKFRSQIIEADNVGADGVILFSYGNLLASGRLQSWSLGAARAD